MDAHVMRRGVELCRGRAQGAWIAGLSIRLLTLTRLHPSSLGSLAVHILLAFPLECPGQEAGPCSSQAVLMLPVWGLCFEPPMEALSVQSSGSHP